MSIMANKNHIIQEPQFTSFNKLIQIKHEHLIFFDFTQHISSNNCNTNKKQKLKTKTLNSLSEFIIKCIDKYGKKNVKIFLDLNASICSKNENRKICYIIESLKNIHGIEIVLLKCIANDLDSHFKALRDKYDEYKYNKITILSINKKSLICKYIIPSFDLISQTEISHYKNKISSQLAMLLFESFSANKSRFEYLF
eukprot:183857_1